MAKKKPKVITKKQFDKWSPTHQQRALNDPRIRVRIEDKALPKEWYERRVRSRFLRNPITPGASETGRELEARRGQMETLTFGEGDRELADRQQRLDRYKADDDAWYKQYREEVANAQTRAQDASRNAVEGSQSLVTGMNETSAANRDRITQQLRDRAASLGQTAPDTSGIESIADQAAATRAAMLGSSLQAQQNRLAANATYTGGLVSASQAASEAARERGRQRQTALETDREDYGKKKGAWREKFVTDAIADARKQVIEDRLAVQEGLFKQAEIDLKNKALAETRRSNMADEATDRTRANNSGSSGGGGGSSKSKSNNDSQDHFKRALATMMGSGIQPNTIVNTSKKGLDSKGRARRYGVEWFISKIIAQNKTEGISREVAKRAVYTYIKYKGRVPGGVTVRNAPKTPPWRR